MQQTIHISTHAHNGLCDIPRREEDILAETGVQSGQVNLHARGATQGIMMQYKMIFPL